MTFNKRIFYLCILVWICSCKSKLKSEMIELGTYKTKPFGRVEWLMHKLVYNEGFIKGQELTLNADSTYTLKSCGGIGSGTFYIQSDSLVFREVKLYLYKNEKTTILDTPHIYSYHILDNNVLERRDYARVILTNKRIRVVDRLIKTRE
jgi:hypothetical protein